MPDKIDIEASKNEDQSTSQDTRDKGSSDQGCTFPMPSDLSVRPSKFAVMTEKIDIEASKNEDHNKLALSDLHNRLKKIHLGGGEKR